MCFAKFSEKFVYLIIFGFWLFKFLLLFFANLFFSSYLFLCVFNVVSIDIINLHI